MRLHSYIVSNQTPEQVGGWLLPRHFKHKQISPRIRELLSHQKIQVAQEHINQQVSLEFNSSPLFQVCQLKFHQLYDLPKSSKNSKPYLKIILKNEPLKIHPDSPRSRSACNQHLWRLLAASALFNVNLQHGGIHADRMKFAEGSPETNSELSTPKWMDGILYRFLLGALKRPMFRGELLVSFREGRNDTTWGHLLESPFLVTQEPTGYWATKKHDLVNTSFLKISKKSDASFNTLVFLCSMDSIYFWFW